MALVLLAGASAALAQGGQGYVTLPTPQPTDTAKGVEVREFFSYGCHHCATFRPLMERWLDGAAPEGVNFTRTPVVFSDGWRPLAQFYYTAETLGVVEQTHAAMFAAIHEQNRRIRGKQDVVRFLVEQGVEEDKAVAAFDSFAVDMKMRQGAQQQRSHRIESTPSVVVAGKFLVSPNTAGGHAGMIQVIDRLVRQELAAR